MSHWVDDAALDGLLTAVDPLTDPPPSAAETDAALRRLLADAPPARSGRTLASDLRLRVAMLRARTRLLAGAVAGSGVVAGALALIFGAATSSPAFAVTRNANGTVTVRFLERSALSDAEMTAINHALAHVNARTRIVATRSGIAVRCADGQPAHGLTIRPRRALTIPTDAAGHLAYTAAEKAAIAHARDLAHRSDADTAARNARGPTISWICG